MKQKETQTLAELVRAAQGGDACAQSELYTRYYNTVYYTAATVVKDEEAALDIVQDSFLKAFTQMGTLSNPEAFPAWIKRIATNNARNWLRKRNPLLFSQIVETDEEGNEMPVEIEDLDLTRQPEEVLDAKTKKELLWAIIDTLSDEQRLVVNMFYFQGLSVADIAQELTVSQNTIKSRLNYGRKKIEAKVLELEKHGTKLYGMAPLAFFVWLFLQNQQVNPVLPVAVSGTDTAGSAAAETAGKSGAAAATAETSAVGAAAGGAALAAGTAVKAAGAVAVKGVAAKVVAGVAAVVLVGGTAAGVAYVKPWQPAQPAAETSAQTEVAPASESTMQTPAVTTPAPTPAPQAEEVLTGLRSVKMNLSTADAYYETASIPGTQGAQGYALYKTDYETAQRSVMMEEEPAGAFLYNSFIADDAYFILTDNTGSNVQMVVYSLEDGTLLRTVPLDFAYNFNFVDEQYGYAFEADNNGYTNGYRVDLQTGTATDLALPHGMCQIDDCLDGRFLIERTASDVDYRAVQDLEQSAALLKNETREYDWWDPDTGELQSILQEPFAGPVDTDGTQLTRMYSGRTEDALYFTLLVATNANPGTDRTDQSIQRCGLDGSNLATVAFQTAGIIGNSSVKQNGRLFWLLFDTENGSMVYDLETGAEYPLTQRIYELPTIRSVTSDGRLLITNRTGADRQSNLVTQENFLAGNFTGTPVQDTAG